MRHSWKQLSVKIDDQIRSVFCCLVAVFFFFFFFKPTRSERHFSMKTHEQAHYSVTPERLNSALGCSFIYLCWEKISLKLCVSFEQSRAKQSGSCRGKRDLKSEKKKKKKEEKKKKRKQKEEDKVWTLRSRVLLSVQTRSRFRNNASYRCRHINSDVFISKPEYIKKGLLTTHCASRVI